MFKIEGSGFRGQMAEALARSAKQSIEFMV